MRSHIFALGLLGLVLLVPCAARAQQNTYTVVDLSFIDPAGAIITNAHIAVAIGSVIEFLAPDIFGHFSLKLPSGDYGIGVSAPGYRSTTVHIDLLSPGTATAATKNVAVVLRRDEGTLVLTAESYPAPVMLSVAEFRALPHVNITVHNGHTEEDEIYSGVALAALLAKVNAPLGDDLRGKALASYVVASGSDGYSVVLSLAEIDPSFHGG
jgi:hypothetical protein